MRDDLMALDIFMNSNSIQSPDHDVPDDLESGGHISLGAKQPWSTLETIEQTHHSDVAFRNFCTRLVHFLQGNLPDIEPLNLQPHDKVSICINKSLSISQML